MAKIFKLKYLLYLVFAVSVVLLIYFVTNAGAIDTEFNANYNTSTKNLGDTAVYTSLSMFLGWAYILLGGAFLLAVILPLIYMIKNPQNLKKMLVNIGLVVALFVVAFLFAKGEPLASNNAAVQEASSQAIKTIDTGLIATYIFMLAAFGAIAWGGIRNLIKNR